MTDAKIIRFPGPRVEVGQTADEVFYPTSTGEVVVNDEDFDTVRAAIEQEVEQAATDLGQCETETEWLVEVNELVERLLAAALRKSPDG